MNEEITASASLDVSSYLLAFKWARHSTRWARGVLYVIVFLCAALALWLGVSDGDVTVSDVLPTLLVPGALAYYIHRTRNVKLLSQQIKQMPGYGDLSSWTITQDGYDSKLGEVHAFVPWPKVVKTVASPDGTLIYIQKEAFEWLPRAAFTTESDYTRFLGLVAAKTKHSKVG